MNLTGTQIITDALVKCTVLVFGQVPTNDLLNGGLQATKDLLDSWLIDELFVYAQRKERFVLTSSRVYTIGPTGDFPTDRPVRISDANYIFTTTPSSLVRRPIAILTAHQWSLIAIQQIDNAVVDVLYYENNFTQPDGNGTINLWPGAPAGNEIELFSWQQLQSFADLKTTYNFPPAYPEAMKWGIAEKLLPMVDRYIKGDKATITAHIVSQSQKTKTALQGYNALDIMSYCDDSFLINTGKARGGAWNFRTGGYGNSL